MVEDVQKTVEVWFSIMEDSQEQPEDSFKVKNGQLVQSLDELVAALQNILQKVLEGWFKT